MSIPRITQTLVEALARLGQTAASRVSQLVTEGLTRRGTSPRVTQVLVETMTRSRVPALDLSGPALTMRRPIRRLRQAPHLSAEQRWIAYGRLQLDLEAGRGLTDGQGIDPQLMLQWSDDGGRTWSNEHWVSAGRLGAYKWRAIWRRLGRSRNRVYRVVQSDPTKVAWIQAFVDAKGGTS